MKTKSKKGRPSIPYREVIELRRLRREGFTIRDLSSITDYSVGAILKYTKTV